MNYKSTLFVLACFALTSFKTGYTWAQAWVDENVLNVNQINLEVKPIQKKSLQLVLLPRKYIVTTTTNGNRYLRCYLINNTDTTSSITRADATITGFTSEILKDGKWMRFQKPMDISCGNSYWTQKLKTKEVLSIQYDHAESGPIAVPFRIVYQHDNHIIYSNEINVNVDQVNYTRVDH